MTLKELKLKRDKLINIVDTQDWDKKETKWAYREIPYVVKEIRKITIEALILKNLAQQDLIKNNKQYDAKTKRIDNYRDQLREMGFNPYFDNHL